MQELIHTIIELLSKHTCVIVPDFGGFVINEKNAVVNTAEGRFSPPRKELIFNSRLSHNDGLLAQALMQKRAISFNEANAIVAEKVKAAKDELTAHRVCSLGSFGFFSMEATGIVFHAKEIKIENTEAFGLKEFYFPTLSTDGVTGSSRASKTPNGINPYISKMVAGGVAAAVALFLFCQPLKDGGTDRASLLPAISFSEAVARNAELIAKEKEEALKYKNLDYYIVIEEMETEEEALSFVDSTETQEGDSLNVLQLGEKFFITFSSSSEFEGINDRIKDLHSRYTAFPNTFVLGIR